LRLRIDKTRYQDSIAISNLACNIEREWGLVCKDMRYYYILAPEYMLHIPVDQCTTLVKYICNIPTDIIYIHTYTRNTFFLNSSLFMMTLSEVFFNHSPKATHLNVCILSSVWARSYFWIGVSTPHLIFPHPLFLFTVYLIITYPKVRSCPNGWQYTDIKMSCLGTVVCVLTHTSINMKWPELLILVWTGL
jgi:hypothetical protein